MSKVSNPSGILEDLRRNIASHAVLIEDYFQPGALVTVLVRNPGVSDGDVLITRDDPAEITSAIHRLASRGPGFLGRS